ncbi:MAG: fused response regulator/phosphatase [Sulfuricellaceae bacterium]|nr:fused response regulator/phosphatase [Sulfuricellaceae bacterium]
MSRKNSAPIEHPAEPMKILVVDDDRISRTLLAHYLDNLGQTVVVADNGTLAVEKFRQEHPDLVIMDVLMPEMDGYEATRHIKQLSGERWVPIIFTSALSTADEQIKGLDSGGDDYLTKPIDFTILASKIRAMQRIANMQRTLQDYKSAMQNEMELARYVMEKLIRSEQLNKEAIQHVMIPAGDFSGDILAVSRTPSGVLHVLLADVSGHGLSAALNAIPVVDVFYSLSDNGAPLPELCRELNRKLKHLMPVEYFVAAAVVAIDAAAKTVSVWNGGAPPVICLSDGGTTLKEFRSIHLALGILSDAQFDGSTESFSCEHLNQLFLFSDGLIEAENSAGAAFGMERLNRVLLESPPLERFRFLHQAVTDFLDGQAAHDDISLIALGCGTPASAA